MANFSLGERKKERKKERKLYETQVEEEYCWAITQETGQSCCSRSDSIVLESGF